MVAGRGGVVGGIAPYMQVAGSNLTQKYLLRTLVQAASS